MKPFWQTEKLVKILTLFCGSGIFLLILFPLITSATFNKQINYQGKLTNVAGSAVTDGNYSIEFKLYAASSGGSALWTETQTVAVTNGLFSIMLGSVTLLDAFDFNRPLYLTLNVEGDGEMTPRKVLGSVPNSFNAEKFDGLATTSFAVLNANNIFAGLNTFTATTTLATTTFFTFNPFTVSQSAGLTLIGTDLGDLSVKNGLALLGYNTNLPELTMSNSSLGSAYYVNDFEPSGTSTAFYFLDTNTDDYTRGVFDFFGDLRINQNYDLSVGGTSTLKELGVSGGIFGDFLPQMDSLYSLGTSSKRWSNLWVDEINSSSTSNLNNIVLSGDISFQKTLEKIADNLELPTKVRNIYVADNYAYIITYATNSVDSFRIVDISNPYLPRVVGGSGLTGLPLADGKRVFAMGNYAYVLYNAVGGMKNPFRIIDISDKSNPVVISGVDLNIANFDSSSGQPFYVSGKYAYLMGGTKLFIIDISDPYSPVVVKELDDVSYSAWDIKVVSDYAYICHREEIGGVMTPLTIINVKDRLNPFVVSKVSIPGLSDGCWSVDVVGSHAYLGLGSIGGGATTNRDLFRIIDISDPYNPEVLGGEEIGSGNFTLSGSGNALNYIKVLGDYLYATTWQDGFLTIDISSSTNPVVVKKEEINDYSGNFDPLTFDFKGRNLIVGYAPVDTSGSGLNDYFRIFKMPGIDVPTANIEALSLGNLQVLNNAIFNQRVSIWDSLEVGSGGVYTQGAFSSMSTSSINYFGGSLGVGTTSPISKLSVVGTTTLSVDNTYWQTSKLFVNGTGDIPLLLAHGASTTDPTTTYDFGAIKNNLYLVNDNGADNAALSFLQVDSVGEAVSSGSLAFDFGSSYFTVNTDFNPVENNAYDLGSPSLSWRNIYASTSISLGSLNSNGPVYSNNGTLTNVNPSSRDYKDNIAEASLNIDGLLGLQVKSFDWKANGQSDFGLIAEEIRDVLPELYVDDGVTRGYRSGQLPFYLLQIAQRQEKKIAELDTRIASGTIAVATSSTEALNIRAIQSIAGNWSISEDGTLVAKNIKAENAIIENGVTIRDRATGNYSCIYIENGVVQTSLGECQSGPPIVPPAAPSDGASPGEFESVASSTEVEVGEATTTSPTEAIPEETESIPPIVETNPPVIIPDEPLPVE